MSDLIRREDAIEVVCELIPIRNDAVEIADALRSLPSAERKGEWIEHKERTIVRNNNFIDFFPTEYECSNCGLRRATYNINSSLCLTNYCPHCGAKMKGAEDEDR